MGTIPEISVSLLSIEDTIRKQFIPQLLVVVYTVKKNVNYYLYQLHAGD